MNRSPRKSRDQWFELSFQERSMLLDAFVDTVDEIHLEILQDRIPEERRDAGYLRSRHYQKRHRDGDKA